MKTEGCRIKFGFDREHPPAPPRVAAGSVSFTTAPPPPDPILWFPGGDAECGTNAGPNNDMSTFSLITLLLSIFNIINMLVSNANNNNNRNNVNDNADNVNQNSNTESNGNPDQASANQVMFTPPGVGRKKRDTHHVQYDHWVLQTKFHNGSVALTLGPPNNFSKQKLQTDFYNIGNTTDVIDELSLGSFMVLNSWMLLQHSPIQQSHQNWSPPLEHPPLQNYPPPNCLVRNICELNENSAVWGGTSGLVAELATLVMAGWLADTQYMEEQLVKAGENGRDLLGCHHLYDKQCPVKLWNQFVQNKRIMDS